MPKVNTALDWKSSNSGSETEAGREGAKGLTSELHHCFIDLTDLPMPGDS